MSLSLRHSAFAQSEGEGLPGTLPRPLPPPPQQSSLHEDRGSLE